MTAGDDRGRIDVAESNPEQRSACPSGTTETASPEPEPGPPPSDPVAVALATALERASAAGEWEAVKVLAAQLDAHRKAREARNVVDFEAAKERRKR